MSHTHMHNKLPKYPGCNMAPSIDSMKMRMVEHAVLTSTLLNLKKIFAYKFFFLKMDVIVYKFPVVVFFVAHKLTHAHTKAEFMKILSIYDRLTFSSDALKFGHPNYLVKIIKI